LALKNNTKAQNSQLSLDAAKQTKKEAFTNYFPSVSAIGMGFQSSDPMMEMASENGSMGMLEKGFIGAVSASQPIFAGGQIINGNKLANLGIEVAELQKTMNDDEILLTVEQYYWQIAALEEKTKTIAEAERLLNRVHTDIENALEVGLVNRNDLLRVELKQNELESGKLKLANGLKLSKMVLAQLIGVSPDNFEIDKSLVEQVSLRLGATVDHQSALFQRAEYQLLDKNIEANKLQVKMEVGKHLPTVAVGATWSYSNIEKGSPLAMDKNLGMVFATVSVPISDWWGGSSAIKRQKIQEMIAENDKRNTEEMLLIQMQQLRNDVDEAALQVQLADKAIAAALENVRLNTDYYEAGIGLLTDLLDALNSLQQVRDQKTEAITIYCVKLARYRGATGQR
jgi:outer membrane protein TolC